MWVALAVVWVAYTSWSFAGGCFYFKDSSVFRPICATGQPKIQGATVATTIDKFGLSDWSRWLGRAFLPPLALLLAGTATLWVADGFRKRPPSN
jgi:hypothetical protein